MAQHQQPEHARRLIASLRIEPYEHIGIRLASRAVGSDGRLDPQHAQAGENTSPPLEWSAIAEADTYVLIVEDPDAPGDNPYRHWVLWDIPGSATSLPVGVDRTPHPADVEGATQGRNDAGGWGWTGMAPPPGHGVHHYHFQLWALPRRLDLPPDTVFEDLVNALKGNALGFGELIGTYEIQDGPQPISSAKPAPDTPQRSG